MAYQSWSVVFGEQPSAAKWNILGTNDSSFNDGSGIGAGAILPNHLFASASTLNTHVWDAFTPTWTNLTVGNGTNSSFYMKIGKTVFYRISFVLGSTSSVGTQPNFTLPVTARSHTGTATMQHIGNLRIFDTSAATSYFGAVYYNNTTTGLIQVWNAASTIITKSDVTSTVPMTWATGDELYIYGFYEAA